MKRSVKGLAAGASALLFLFVLSGMAVGADSQTIVGTVNADFQIVADDGLVYEVEENEEGDEVVELIGKKVKVSGTVEESEGLKWLNVTSYEVIE